MLQPPEETPFTGDNFIAFAIAGSSVTRDTGQKHIGLVYRSDDRSPMLLHLRWERDLGHESWNGRYHWHEFPGIDPEVQESFAFFAAEVAAHSECGEIPYSLIYHEDANFGADGHYIARSDGSGLTCASFLIALFDAYQMPLVNLETWPRGRSEDLAWFDRILGYLKECIPFPRYAAHINQRQRLKRFRPEEVFATAGLYQGLPLNFSEIAAASEELLAQIPP